MHVLVLGHRDAPYLQELERIPEGVRVTVGLDATEVSDVDAVLLTMGNSAHLRPLWPKLRTLSWVHSLSAGVELVLFDELVRSDVTLTNARGVYAPSLGEWAMSAMLFFTKDHARLLRAQREKRWERFTVEELEGKTLVVVGYGEIGRETAKRAKAMGMRVVGVRKRPVPCEYADDVVGDARMLEVLAHADVVLCALPSTPATTRLVGKAAFDAMVKRPVFINVGRGETVDEDALVEALPRLKGAALDVFATEPLPSSSPLWSMENVLISPHCADQTGRWLHLSMRLFVENIRRRMEGRPLLNVVDKIAGY